MRKFLFLLVVLTAFPSFAQDKSNEIRLNAFSVIAFKQLDLSYEYIISEESSVGLSLALDLDKKNRNGFFGGNTDYIITPYYRYQLPEDIIDGLFLEAFLAANGGVNKNKIETTDTKASEDEEGYEYLEYNDFAFGLGGGYKYISDGGFIAELYGGAGRNLKGGDAPDVLVRVGVSFGFRF
ncbi:MAG TPA: hypothetical protein EYG92_04215 [Lutibacter sp.]|nr:hypothetical protein [Lutibacter sp.]